MKENVFQVVCYQETGLVGTFDRRSTQVGDNQLTKAFCWDIEAAVVLAKLCKAAIDDDFVNANRPDFCVFNVSNTTR